MAGSKGPGAGALLGLPSFLFAVFVFYWSLPIFAAPYRIRFANLTGPRNDVLDWCVSLSLPRLCTWGQHQCMPRDCMHGRQADAAVHAGSRHGHCLHGAANAQPHCNNPSSMCADSSCIDTDVHAFVVSVSSFARLTTQLVMCCMPLALCMACISRRGDGMGPPMLPAVCAADAPVTGVACLSSGGAACRARSLVGFFGVTVLHYGQQSLYMGPKCLYLVGR